MWGESDAGWPCTRDKTYAEAEAICQAAGARLCTATELADGCTAGTGCQFDSELVWGVPPPPIATATSLLTKDDAGAQVDFTAILIGGAAAAVALLALLVLASRCVPSAPRARCVSQPAFSDWPVAPTLPPQHTGHTTDAATGAEQAVVEGLRPRRRQGIWIGTQV